MKRNIVFLFVLACICVTQPVQAQDTLYIKAHFLFGSKTKRAFKKTEHKWFGGKLGGHAGVETRPNHIIDFGPRGSFHVFSHRKNRHSGFAVHDTVDFYEFFGTSRELAQRMTVTIPITAAQQKKLDSLEQCYRSATPYDYAFFGMRCGAAAYDVLSVIGVVRKYGTAKTARKIFYPRKLRRRLMKQARSQGWKIDFHEGNNRRRWEKV